MQVLLLSATESNVKLVKRHFIFNYKPSVVIANTSTKLVQLKHVYAKAKQMDLCNSPSCEGL